MREVDMPLEIQDPGITSQIDRVLPSASKFRETLTERLSIRNLQVSYDKFLRNLRDIEAIPGFRWNSDFVIAGYSTASHNAKLDSSKPNQSTFGGARYANMLAVFKDLFRVWPSLNKKRVLDVGPWAGATSIVFESEGAVVDVIELEPVPLAILHFLKDSFALNYRILDNDVYALKSRSDYDEIFCLGVIYHLTDPLVALRIMNRALKPNGGLYVETHAALASDEKAVCLYEGAGVVGANWFVPNGKALCRWLTDAGYHNILVSNPRNKQHLYSRLFSYGTARDANDPWRPLYHGWSVRP